LRSAQGDFGKEGVGETMTDWENKKDVTRREVLRGSVRSACLFGIGAIGGLLARRAKAVDTVWQIDPYKCISCGNCATHCVQKPSAVKCVHAFAMCGYCDLCTGYFEPETVSLDTGAENQLCPTGAINRRFVEAPYFEFTIDEKLCIGCGKCVKGCNAFGNGSLFLQVRHDRCLNCNECSIAKACPSGAFQRVSADEPYLLKEVKSGE